MVRRFLFFGLLLLATITIVLAHPLPATDPTIPTTAPATTVDPTGGATAAAATNPAAPEQSKRDKLLGKAKDYVKDHPFSIGMGALALGFSGPVGWGIGLGGMLIDTYRNYKKDKNEKLNALNTTASPTGTTPAIPAPTS
ncbi:hypothetical protein H4R33_003793 [Dimargaris cristalligena]|uniref:Uncharacterized protein n=1 Tax=Dimargaris cristalligena TaxID=215637 RepID=A0A4P9ZSQ0_9FUNG|nr:hypothetical protein H4R33_003793 [Dimargaris cristalligena]RKP36435.1 hypothetical protein BJ085DRAFT_38682 [Dimargaris cristalligena]|eukprot:RKP36435.1 hypothetical protein BJ085DRAFT_38682 [Dimargaris cristalligena]